MADALRRYVDALVEIGQTTRERTERIVDELAKRGEPLTKDFQQQARELLDRSARNQREFVSLVQKEFRRLTARDATESARRSPSGAKAKPKTTSKASQKKKPAAKKKAATRKRTTSARTRKPATGR